MLFTGLLSLKFQNTHFVRFFENTKSTGSYELKGLDEFVSIIPAKLLETELHSLDPQSSNKHNENGACKASYSELSFLVYRNVITHCLKCLKCSVKGTTL